MQTNNPVWGGSLAVLGLAGKGHLASFSRHSQCMAGPPLEAERPLWRQPRHGMPQQRARRTPRSSQRAAQSHRSDLVALELRGAKLLSIIERDPLPYAIEIGEILLDVPRQLKPTAHLQLRPNEEVRGSGRTRVSLSAKGARPT